MTASHSQQLGNRHVAPRIATAIVHTLLCHRDVDLAITCLGSLTRYSRAEHPLVIHEDGSLTPEDREKLHAAFTVLSIIDRASADARMTELLRRLPACSAYRSSNVFGLKLFDIGLLGEEEIIAYCDADILFVRPFTGLYDIPADFGGIVTRDIESVYSVRSWHMLGGKTPLGRNVNAGLLCIRRSAFDLDQIEWFFAQTRHRRKPYFSEQTCWAFLARKQNFGMWDPRQIRVMAPTDKPDGDFVGGHFAGRTRHLLPLFQKSVARATDTPQTIRTVPLERSGFFDLARCETARVASRIRKKFK